MKPTPSALQLLQEDLLTSLFDAFRFVYRENRVPHYQRLFQNHDGKRQWWKVRSSLPDTLSYPDFNGQLNKRLRHRPSVAASCCILTSSLSTAWGLVSTIAFGSHIYQTSC